MTDAQALFDYARRQFNGIAEDVERHFEAVAGQLREWIPPDGHIMRAAAPPKALPPPSTLQLAQRWISKQRSLTAALVAFLVTGSIGTFVYIKNKDAKRKRRARKSPSGARTDVVVVVGAAANPVISALSLDLERRGFVVYAVTNTAADENYIRSQGRADLLSLRIDLIDPFQAQEQLERFADLLDRPHVAFEGAEPHNLHFAGLILVPDSQSPPTRVQYISSEEWSDALNAKVLNTIATTQLFLRTVTDHKAKILLLTPSVRPALSPPLHAIECATYGALEGFINCLSKEVNDQGVLISHFKLGNIDIPAVTAKLRREGHQAPRIKATPLRKLHDAVFDALTAENPHRTWHVGRGSLAYDIIGSWIPNTITGWMMGVGRKPPLVVEQPRDELQLSQGSLSPTWEKIESDG